MDKRTLKSCLDLPKINRNLTVPQFLIERAQFHAQNGKSAWMIDSQTDERFYFKDFEETTMRIGSWLNKKGMKKGDTLMYLNSNYSKEHLLLNGVWRANGIVRASYPQDTRETLLARVIESRATFLYCDKEMTDKCLSIAKEVDWPLVVIANELVDGCVFIDDIFQDDGLNCPNVEINTDDPALILCTSGTTGNSKGAMRTHASILQVLQIHLLYPWQDPTLIGSAGTHISGTLFPMGNLVKGVSTVVVYQLTSEKLMRAIDKYKPKFLHAFPTFLLALVNDKQAQKYDLSSIEFILTGGVVISSTTREQLMRLKGLKHIINMYGLTETLYTVSNLNFKENNDWEYLDVPSESIGKVSIGVSLQIRDLETGEILGANQKGEICVKASDMFSNYINAPEETLNAFTEDGYFRTGDIGSFCDLEFLTVHGRSKEIFKYFNNHVSPSEIDQVLSQHPAISEVCTIGVIHTDQVNFVPRAFVTLKPGSSASTEDIIQFANDKLADYQHLRGGVVIVDKLPRGSTGKVQRSLVSKLLNS